ncbi:MAG: hypothetical protein AAF755_07580 [Pseudomonadota bacterium]
MDQSTHQLGGLSIAGQQIDGSSDAFHVIEKHLTVPYERQASDTFQSGDEASIRALEHPIARQIVDAMKSSRQPHSFASSFDLGQDIAFRIHAIQAMSQANTGQYDMDYFNPDIGLKPRLGSADATRLSQYWAFLYPSQEWDAEFVQTSGTVPADAIAPVENVMFPFRGECAGAFQMAVYFGLLNGLGRNRFDDMATKFGTMYVGPWRLTNGDPNPATLFMKSAPLTNTAIPGDYMYFKNKDDYLHWCPNGFWTGLNAMYMGNDALGTPHYSGMGASWLSETNLRAALVNAYYHDCSPHTIDKPLTEVRFTERCLLSIPNDLGDTMPPIDADTTPKSTSAPSATQLAAAGFKATEGGVHHHPGTTLGHLAKALNFHPDELRQVTSAGYENPPHRVTQNGVTTIVHYADPQADRRDPKANVTAHTKLNI